MFFMTTGKPVVAAIQAGLIGYLTSPNSFYLPPGDKVYWALDNGCFSESLDAPASGTTHTSTPRKSKPDNFNEAKWFKRMDDYLHVQGNSLFVTAPDVFGDYQGTLTRSMPYLSQIRARGYDAALVAQPGATPTNLPWDEFDCLFIGGPDEFRWADAPALVWEANNRGKWVHLGRCNSLKRLRWGEAIGCHSADGTCGTYNDKLDMICDWSHTLQNHRALFDLLGEHGAPA